MKNKKRLLLSLTAIIVCAAVIAAVCVFTFGGGSKSPDHVKVEQPAATVDGGGLKVRLIREKLETVTLNKRGLLKRSVDEEPKDFSSSKDNIFGIDTNLTVAPGCFFTAYMAVSNQRQSPFEYWIEIVPIGGELLAVQFEFTVETSDGVIVKRTIDGGVVTQPLPEVESGATSRFTAKLEYLDTAENDQTKNTALSFDMTVHARLT